MRDSSASRASSLALRDTSFHAGLERAIARLLRRVEDGDRQRGLAVLFREDQRSERLASGPVLIEYFRAHDALRRHDLAIDAAHPHVACRRALRQTPAKRAADLQIDLADDE